MSPEAEILLLILAANGGTMDKPDAERELHRVLSLSLDEQAQWRRWIAPVVQAQARRALRGEGDA